MTKTSLGSTAEGALRSQARKAAVSPAPASTAITVATRWGRMLATLTAATAAVSRTRDHTGTGSRDGARSVRGIDRTTRTPIATETAARPMKAARQAPNWANRPPTTGPTMLPTPHIADTSAAARVQSRSGSVRWISA